jgi:hypothetical protein
MKLFLVKRAENLITRDPSETGLSREPSSTHHAEVVLDVAGEVLVGPDDLDDPEGPELVMDKLCYPTNLFPPMKLQTN